MIRGVVSLPHGTGKLLRVLALVTPDKELEAKEACYFIGLDEYLQKLKMVGRCRCYCNHKRYG